MQAQQSWIEMPLEKRINELAESYGLTMWADKEGEDMNKMKAEFKQKLMGMMSNSLQAHNECHSLKNNSHKHHLRYHLHLI